MKRVLLFDVCSTDGTSGLDSPGTLVAEAVAAWDHDFSLGFSEANGTFGAECWHFGQISVVRWQLLDFCGIVTGIFVVTQRLSETHQCVEHHQLSHRFRRRIRIGR